LRYLVETNDGEAPFTLARDEPLKEGQNFWRQSAPGSESRLYIARIIAAGRDEYDNVVKADFAGTTPGPAQPAEYEGLQ
jgi:hypothetical protein